jgi:hypothetical protein
MKRILEKLLLGTGGTPYIFRFDEDDGALGWVAESVINSAGAEWELWNDVGSVVYLPADGVEYTQNDALRNRRLVRIPPGSDSTLDVFNVIFEGHGHVQRLTQV